MAPCPFWLDLSLGSDLHPDFDDSQCRHALSLLRCVAASLLSSSVVMRANRPAGTEMGTTYTGTRLLRQSNALATVDPSPARTVAIVLMILHQVRGLGGFTLAAHCI